ncbi:MAG: protease, partial [Bacteroidota bacterium]
MKKICYQPILLLLLLGWQINVSQAQGTRLLRQPSISTRFIAFVYANDLWLVPQAGGEARRLTSDQGAETQPHFSPDGRMIAYTGRYDGNTDVYVIPATGGQPRRLTWHPGADRVTGWSPDGQSVLFMSGREGVPTKEQKFYQVSLKGGMPQALNIPRAAQGEISADGKYAAYQLVSFWDPEWRNYRGGQAKPIWIVDLKTLKLTKTPRSDQERHTDPVWLDGKVYFLSERDYANNIWSFDPASNELKQQTFHADFDVKSLDAGDGKIVYEQGGYLHILNPQTGKKEQLEIQVKGDFHWARPRWQKIRASQLNNASLSPKGKRALFEYRGEIFTVPKEDGNWRNISQSPGVADRFPTWSPDGQKIAWFSDHKGEYQLIIKDQKGFEPAREILLENPSFYFRPLWSPDGKYIAFTDTDFNLWYVDVKTGSRIKVDTEKYAHPNRSMNPVWSPDSRWIAYARLLDNQFKAIKVYDTQSAKTYQLTDGMSDAMAPIWDASGKYLYFLASTDYALSTGWLDMSSYDH